ncbi:hypothetical protein ACLUEY_15340 [Vreelandella aquamarina]
MLTLLAYQGRPKGLPFLLLAKPSVLRRMLRFLTFYQALTLCKPESVGYTQPLSHKPDRHLAAYFPEHRFQNIAYDIHWKELLHSQK